MNSELGPGTKVHWDFKFTYVLQQNCTSTSTESTLWQKVALSILRYWVCIFFHAVLVLVFDICSQINFVSFVFCNWIKIFVSFVIQQNLKMSARCEQLCKAMFAFALNSSSSCACNRSVSTISINVLVYLFYCSCSCAACYICQLCDIY